MSNHAKKESGNPRGKPTRGEIAIVLRPLVEQSARAYMGLCDLTDLLIQKGVINVEEFQAFVTARHSPALQGTIAEAQNAASDPVPVPAPTPAEPEILKSQVAREAEGIADATGIPDEPSEATVLT
jgi:hypothetical protein